MTLTEAKKEIIELANNTKSEEARTAYFAALYFINQVNSSEVKQKIKEQMDFYSELADSRKDDEYGNPWKYSDGRVSGLEDALRILEEVE